jgi:putative oxidoreductase
VSHSLLRVDGKVGVKVDQLTTFDLALFVLRLALGGMLVAHGLNKVFGSGGLAGTTRWFASLGLQPAWVHARVAAATEIGAGVLLVLGLLTPVASAAFIGLMTVAALTDHGRKGFFVFKGGWEYVAIVAVVAAVIAAIGSGEWSLDHALGWHLYGWSWALVAILLGIVAACGLVLVARSRWLAEVSG